MQGEADADDLDDFLPAADNDQYDEDDAIEEDGEQSHPSRASATASTKQGTPKPILKVRTNT